LSSKQNSPRNDMSTTPFTVSMQSSFLQQQVTSVLNASLLVKK
jgi:hypothetical protein